ncbi:hypothetical protein [Pseudomonas lundensis]|uniref:hypothetical protein n=1 Tax=Pseudomonas lundensis TaxID=86185 RepID=UPI001473D23E|nr:hypothetical protein [Pseudomonas lundensis]NNA01929.1 hypothetical protein [Pseudomonas lundensis]
MEQMGISAVGMLWFSSAGQYKDFLAIFEDAEVMPSTFSKWQERATQIHDNVINTGSVIIKAYASPDEFRAWCAAHNHGLDAKGRMAFASFQAAQKINQAHPAQKNH